MTLGESLKTCLKDKYCCFKGKATRSEFWFFAIFYILISVPLNFIGYSLAELYFFSTYDYTYYTVMILFLIAFNLFFIIPLWSVSARRLHDRNMSGWFQLITLLPFGFIPYLIVMLLPTKPGKNYFED